jgi:hypothetical protein
MADLDSQRLQQQVDELTNKLNGLSANSNKAAGATGKVATKNEQLAASAGTAADALTSLTKQIYQGQQGAKVFSDAVRRGAESAAGITAALGKNSKLAVGAGILGVGLVKLGAMAAEMSDDLFKSFQGLTRVGAVGSEGLTGVFDQLQNFRLSLQDLGQLTQLFAENAKSLALFGGTVTAGAKSLGQLRKIITTTGLEGEFMALGMNTQEINEAMAGYVATQVSTGRIQRMNTDQLVSGTEAYVKQMDELTKLTGVSRKEAESQIEANMRNERFAATVEKVRREQGDEAAENLRRNMAFLSAQYPDTAEGLKDIAGGFVNTQAAQKAFLSGFGPVTKQLTGDLGPALNTLSQASQRNTRNFESLAQVGAFGNTFGSFNEQLKISGLSAVDMAKAQEQARQEQTDQIKNTEEGVKAQIDLRKSQMDTMQNLQRFINLGVNPATQALAGLAKAGLELSSTLPGAKATRGYGQQGTASLGGSLAATGAGAAGGAVAGLPGGLPGVAIGGIVGGILGKLGYDQFAGGTAAINPDDVIEFGSGTGSRQHFDQLSPEVRERALAMAYAYNQETEGQKLRLESAFRSAEEQADLIRRGAQGNRPIAEPGQSLHQQGRALDFKTRDVESLERMGLLKEFGFNRLRGDPPHIYMQDGGIASGPKSGYQATLHGTEAVVPLPDGKTIPVTMPEMSSQVSMMSEQITRLDELIALMRNANGISNKILQAANN